MNNTCSINNLGQTFFVIDAMPLLYRGHFVFLRNPRLTSSGVNTSSLFVFGSVLARIIDDFKPSHIAVAFDSRTPTFRHQLFPEYKAQRQKIPEDLSAAIPMADELCRALGIMVLQQDGFEADDLMGTTARMAAESGLDSVLVTPDKDVAQLVGRRTRLFRPGSRNKPDEMMGPEEVCRRWGLDSPGKMVDFLGLAGDASDNIPGIAGIGEKTAIALLQRFGSLEGIFRNLAELTEKQADKIREGEQAARLSRELSQIRCDVPLVLSLDDFRRREADLAALRDLVERYELNQLGRRWLSDVPARPAPSGGKVNDLSDTAHSYTVVKDNAVLEDLLRRLAAAAGWAFDTETTGLDIRESELIGISFCLEPHTAWYVPVPGETSARTRLLERLKPVFATPGVEKVGHNLKFDLAVLHRAGIAVEGPLRDTMLAGYVLDASDRHGLDHLARQRLNYEMVSLESLIGKRGRDQLTLADLPVEKVGEYGAEDADITLRLHRLLRPEVASAGAMPALAECEEPLIDVLLKMESEGIRFDPAALRHYSRELQTELTDLERKIHEEAGTDFNIDSPKQLGEVLFDRLKLDPRAARTRGGQYATSEDVLQKMAGLHPVVDLALEYRGCAKLKNTYVDKLPNFVSPETGRIHSSFSQAMTETGRLSSQNPNLQNIPIRGGRGRRIREAFVPRDPDHLLLAADYSQIELRIMAAFSQDRGMIEAFRRGKDIHGETAARMHGVMPELVTREMRAQAKTVNFGIIYGISAYGLSRRLGISRQQAAHLIETYFNQYPAVRQYMEQTVATAREAGYAKTILGRRRLLRDIHSRNSTSRRAAERTAINTPIQGTAADIIKLAMVSLRRELNARGLRSKMILQVHDELLFDVHRDELETVRELARERMTGVIELAQVSLEVEVGVGKNWLAAHG